MREHIYEDKTTKIIVTYSNTGKLKKVIAKKGFISGKITHAIGFEEKEINTALFKPYTTVKDEFFSKAQKAWFEFYKKNSGLDYRFTKIDGGALKSIGKHLTDISGGSYEAIESWKFILYNWNRLDPFYRNHVDLKFINSQLNKILNLLKNGKQTSQASTRSDADDLRESFK